MFELKTCDKYESKEYTSDSCWSKESVDRCESKESTFDYSGSTGPEKRPEANAWAKEYPAWPLLGMPVPKTPLEPKRTRWADEEALDAVAAERVARALAVNCQHWKGALPKSQRQARVP